MALAMQTEIQRAFFWRMNENMREIKLKVSTKRFLVALPFIHDMLRAHKAKKIVLSGCENAPTTQNLTMRYLCVQPALPKQEKKVNKNWAQICWKIKASSRVRQFFFLFSARTNGKLYIAV